MTQLWIYEVGLRPTSTSVKRKNHLPFKLSFKFVFGLCRSLVIAVHSAQFKWLTTGYSAIGSFTAGWTLKMTACVLRRLAVVIYSMPFILRWISNALNGQYTYSKRSSAQNSTAEAYAMFFTPVVITHNDMVTIYYPSLADAIGYMTRENSPPSDRWHSILKCFRRALRLYGNHTSARAERNQVAMLLITISLIYPSLDIKKAYSIYQSSHVCDPFHWRESSFYRKWR